MIKTAPIATVERIDVLDAVRGVAVLGILLINVNALSGFAFIPPTNVAGSRFDGSVFFVLSWLIEGKFYALFSFLFGVGFAVFVQRAAARGAEPAQLFKRRLIGLLLIGFIHTFFIWMGDILLTYAVLGFGLVPFLKKSDRTVIRWAVTMLLLPIALYAVLLGVLAVLGTTQLAAAPASGTESGLPPVLADAVEKFIHGGYFAIVQGNVAFTAANVVRRFILMFFPRVFGMFLLGFYVGRRRMFADLGAHRPLIMRTLVVGTTIGLPLAFVGARLEGGAFPAANVRGLMETTVKSVSIPALALGYAAALCLVFQRAPALMRALAPVGRMALTNYLMHSFIGTAVFYGIGFGQFGKTSLTFAVAGGFAVYLLQIVLSRIWLTYAAFGPAEWIWRMLTYRTRMSIWGQTGVRPRSGPGLTPV
ncbi:MAG: DUF418 domain-containing protein [Vicinamibacterales bacterium]